MHHAEHRCATPVRLGLIAAALALAAAAPAHAGTAQTNLSVSANVTANCTISTSPVAFGDYDPVVANASTALTASGQVTVRCTKSTVPTITLGPGGNFASGTRNMANGSERLAYQLYQPPTTTPNAACAASPTQVWDASVGGTFAPGAAPSAAPRAFNVCGVVPAGQVTAAVGSYSDTVVATVNF